MSQYRQFRSDDDKSKRLGHVTKLYLRNQVEYLFIYTLIINHLFLITNRFEHIFDDRTSQEGLFNILAKPIINRVLEGYNGTIFAYGQTGSGKTYTMTGSSEYYEERGIVPRSIEEIFNCTKQASISINREQYSIYVSYLEIYNEIGYDLLDSKRQISSLNDFVDEVEMATRSTTTTHNIKHHKVNSEEEAMMLLLVGDSNRITVETTRNMFSSRSHCIFTITISFKNTLNGKIRRSKLNLIDLAGSERVSKSKLSGTTLKEAKHINLSLHYLQHVILALYKKRKYVPFRNSMLTYLLKDSLSGHSVTVLLANLDVKMSNIEETIATCNFSQKVGNVIIETKVNKEIDPQEEIGHLNDLIRELRLQLSNTSKFKQNGAISKEEKENCKILVSNYLLNPKEELSLESMGMRAIRFCFKLLKQVAKEYEADKLTLQTKEKDNRDAIKQYSQIVQEQEKEIVRLKSVTTSSAGNIATLTSRFSKENISNSLKNATEIEFHNESIEKIYEEAANLTSLIERCQKNILNDRKSALMTNSQQIKENLVSHQELYRKSLAKLQHLKNKSDNLKIGLKRETEKVMSSFQKFHDHIEWNHFMVENQASILTSRSYSDKSSTSPIFNEAEESKKEICDYGNTKLCNYRKGNVTQKPNCSKVFKERDLNVAPFCNNTICSTAADINSSVSTQFSNRRYHFSIADDELECAHEISSSSSVHNYTGHWNTPEREDNKENESNNNVLYSNDPPEFVEFMSKIALTGDPVVDEEIVRFYRTKFLFAANI
ncbi:hypothetical protein RI129_007570 [Pyrocoelia pectoralis]|uniref:Kinesin-like protein n=1 Tax=Pyrocoelia pectoralis TaxID=417401 RepID=A0AAN7V899_9COLE